MSGLQPLPVIRWAIDAPHTVQALSHRFEMGLKCTATLITWYNSVTRRLCGIFGVDFSFTKSATIATRPTLRIVILINLLVWECARRPWPSKNPWPGLLHLSCLRSLRLYHLLIVLRLTIHGRPWALPELARSIHHQSRRLIVCVLAAN